MRKILYLSPASSVLSLVIQDSMLASSSANASGTGRDLSLVDAYSTNDFDDLFN